MFKAEPNAGSEISCYSRGRRKTRRKRPKMTTENREYFMRHELRGTGFASPRGDRPLLGAFGQPNQAKSIGFGRSSPTLWGDKANKGPTVKEGVNLFVETLRTCGGIATPDQLREAYKRLIGVEWGPAECLKYFGECTTRDAIVNYMADLVEIVTVGDRRIYRLLNKPSLSPHECVVNAVLERYPDTVHMDDLPQILEKHSVRVPMDQPLTQQVPRSFIAYLEVNMDGRITLDLKGLGVNARDLRSQSGAPSDGIWGKVMEHVLELPCSSSSESEIEAEHKHAKNSAGGRATVV
ncbi:unnamed protein product [Heligmosomoides polygyrus]|uniref:OTU domain-containing protein n=1 Tax=Heligmosomoides polygyrus TaxID=6339 RepID=A0A3P8DGL5_HELPZ|nr:unnamed protein product [Heligmosomoides polygyrus]